VTEGVDHAVFREAEVFRADDGRIDHVEAQGIGAVGVEDLGGVWIILQAFGHLAAVFGEDETVDDDILIGRLIEERGAEQHQRVKPTPCLIETFGNEISREEFCQLVFAFKGVVLLRIGHGAGFKPAVENLGGAVIGLAVFFENDLVDVVLVQVGDGLAGELLQFGDGADADHVLAIFGDPDGNAGPPEPVARDVPVLGVLEPVAEALLADGGGHPMHISVVGGQLVAQIFHTDIPRIDGAIDQRGVGARAEGIGMEQRRLVYELAAVLEGADDFLVGVLAEDAVIFGNGLGEGADIVEVFQKRNAGSFANAEVILTEGRGAMDEAGAVFGGDKAVVEHLEAVLGSGEGREDGFVRQTQQVSTLPVAQNLILFRFLVGRGKAGFCQQIEGAFRGVAHGDIVDIGPGADGQIAVERPGGCGPDQGIYRSFTGIKPGGDLVQLDTDGDGGVLHILIVAAGLEVGEGRIKLPGIRHDTVRLIDAPLFPELLEDPPDSLHERDVHRFVIILKIHPAAHAGDGLAPFLDIGQHHGAAGLIEHIHPAGNDVGGPGEPELLLSEGFDGQAMAIPAKPALDGMAAHGLVARSDILDGSRQQMAVVGQSGGKRGAVIENVVLGTLAVIDGLLERAVFRPETEDFFFHLRKRNFTGYRLKHGFPYGGDGIFRDLWRGGR